jgi:Flp pilus assembly pilin Flp
MRIARKNLRRTGKVKMAGMAATEYVIGLVLIAVGSIGIFTVFGAQIKTKLGMIVAALGGDQGKYTDALTSSGTETGKITQENMKSKGMKGDENIIIQ